MLWERCRKMRKAVSSRGEASCWSAIFLVFFLACRHSFCYRSTRPGGTQIVLVLATESKTVYSAVVPVNQDLHHQTSTFKNTGDKWLWVGRVKVLRSAKAWQVLAVHCLKTKSVQSSKEENRAVGNRQTSRKNLMEPTQQSWHILPKKIFTTNPAVGETVRRLFEMSNTVRFQDDIDCLCY